MEDLEVCATPDNVETDCFAIFCALCSKTRLHSKILDGIAGQCLCFDIKFRFYKIVVHTTIQMKVNFIAGNQNSI